MAKGKAGGGVQNKAIYSRISFLQQAAVALACAGRSDAEFGSGDAAQPACVRTPGLSASGQVEPAPLEAMGRRLATDLRAVSLKTRIRLKPAVKQTICKFCDSVLLDGVSCTSVIENKSKGARKPWADVLARKCHTCGKERRYPVNAPRPRQKTERGIGGDDGHPPPQGYKG